MHNSSTFPVLVVKARYDQILVGTSPQTVRLIAVVPSYSKSVALYLVHRNLVCALELHTWACSDCSKKARERTIDALSNSCASASSRCMDEGSSTLAARDVWWNCC